MPHLSHAPYDGLIRSLPVLHHSEELDAAFWQPKFAAAGQATLFGAIFGGHATIRLSRDRLISFAYPTVEQKCAEILLWGYPRNQRGIPARGLTLLPQLSAAATSALNWPAYHSGFPRGFGPSTTTKFAYFFNRVFAGFPALILDKRVLEALPHWHEVATPVIRPYSYSTIRGYLSYLGNMTATAGAIGGRADAIEFFLFSMGKCF